MQYKTLIFIFFLFSCNSILKNAIKVNRKFSFATQSDYYKYLVNKKEFSPNQILFPDSVSYIEFGQRVLMTENPVIYFGSFLNDSVSIKKSDFLKDNQGCVGRMNGEIERNLKTTSFSDTMVQTNINLAKFKFYYLNDKKRFSVSDSKKQLKIFLLYYYPYGTFYDKLYKEINEACLKNITKTDIYIICIDPVYTLKIE